MELNIDKRKIEINNKNNLGLGFWDLCFWQNNPIQVNNEAEIADRLRTYWEMGINGLYNVVNNPNNFIISTQNNPDLDRYFNGEINALIARGQAQEAEYYQRNAEQQKQQLAQTFGEKQYEEYKHLVDFFAGSNYPASFQWLLLNETLQNTYRMDFSKSEPKLIVNPRKQNQTILGMMNLPTQVVEYIYNNGPNYTSFKKLYTDAQVEFQKVIAQESGVNFENVNTFDKGQWIKFASQKNDPQNFEQNVANLKALVADTPWCTSTLASTHLSQGDFYVFADNNGKAHIAVKMNGNAIDEVRGIKNGNAQELEDDYRDVAVNFLENNQEIKNGKEWLDKEEWNQRLINYKQEILNGTFESGEIEQLVQNLHHKDYRANFGINNNLTELKQLLPNIKPQLAQYFNYAEDEFCAGDYNPSEETVCPYAFILGDANFKDSKVTSLGNLQSIGGNANFRDSQITSLGNLLSVGGYADFGASKVADLGNLQCIGGDANFNNSQVTDLGNLQIISGNANFNNSQVTNLGNLQIISGNADFFSSQITDLGNLQSIGGDANFCSSQVIDLGNLQSIGGKADFTCSQEIDLGNLQSIGGEVIFEDSQITDLGNLQSIGGDADFIFSKVTSLGNLHSIGGFADFGSSQITDLGNLQSIGGRADFRYSQVINLGNLQRIGGYADFRDSQVTDLSNLQRIGGYADFRDSQVTDLSNLQSIGGYANFYGSQVTDLGNLQSIGGHANFVDSKITSLGNLQSVGGDADFIRSKVTSLSNLQSVGGMILIDKSQIIDVSGIEQAIQGVALYNIESLGNGPEKVMSLDEYKSYTANQTAQQEKQ